MSLLCEGIRGVCHMGWSTYHRSYFLLYKYLPLVSLQFYQKVKYYTKLSKNKGLNMFLVPLKKFNFESL